METGYPERSCFTIRAGKIMKNYGKIYVKLRKKMLDMAFYLCYHAKLHYDR